MSVKVYVVFSKYSNFDISFKNQIFDCIKNNCPNCQILTDKITDRIPNEVVKDVNYLISFGGDGTLIRSIKRFAPFSNTIKVAGINTGNLGFLTQGDKSNWETVIKLLFSSEAKFSKHFLYEYINNEKKFYFMNDINYRRHDTFSIFNFEIFQKKNSKNGLVISTFGDGALISTPLGSTAYSFNNQGALIEPSVNCLLVNLMCCNSRAKNVILNAEYSIVVNINKGRHPCKVVVEIDGITGDILSGKNSFTISKSKISFDLLNLTDFDWFNALNTKILV